MVARLAEAGAAIPETALPIPVEHVRTEVRDQQIVPAVVVNVPDACGLAPARRIETDLARRNPELSGPVVYIQRGERTGIRLLKFHRRAVDDEDIVVSVPVEIEDGRSGAGGLDDVRARFGTAVRYGLHQPGGSGDVDVSRCAA